MSYPTVLMDVAIVVTGLMAGLYLGWAISVLPGLSLLKNQDYLGAFQQMNRAILNVHFKSLFFLALLMGPIAATAHLRIHGIDSSLRLVVAAALLLLGHGAITALGNIPINERLDRLDLSTASSETMVEQRQAFETRWRIYHWARTCATGAAFLLLVMERVV